MRPDLLKKAAMESAVTFTGYVYQPHAAKELGLCRHHKFGKAGLLWRIFHRHHR